MTTWGESHGPAMGVVLDGCPAGIPFSEEDLQRELVRRRPGGTLYTSPRKERDHAVILSGLWEGKTTGTPLSIMIPNEDVRPEAYAPIASLLRPGHGTYTYHQKYGHFDPRGGGRASARETVCRVAAGAFAKTLLAREGIRVLAFLSQIGPITKDWEETPLETLAPLTTPEGIFCPDAALRTQMEAHLTHIMAQGDSCGGAVRFLVEGLPPGLGDPVYEKLEANLAKALMGLPASKAFEMGSGREAASMQGSQHNDLFCALSGPVTSTNHAGGTLAGISTGMPLRGEVYFKPTSSINKPQATLALDGTSHTLTLPPGSRHDPCVAIRAVPVVEAMVAWVLADAWLCQRMARG